MSMEEGAPGFEVAGAAMASARSAESKADVIAFIEQLRSAMNAYPDRFESVTLDNYLEALGAWLTDRSGYYKNRGSAEPDEVTWSQVADMLAAASIYE